MKRRLTLILFCCAIVSGGCSSHTTRMKASNEEIIIKKTHEMLDGYRGEKNISIAIVDNDKTAISTQITNIVYKTIFNDGRFIIVEREMLDRIMKEMTLQQTGLVDSEVALKVGKLTGAKVILFIKKDSDYILRMVSVKSSEVLAYNYISNSDMVETADQIYDKERKDTAKITTPEYDIKIFQDVAMSKKIGIDLYHGASWKGIENTINETGFNLNFIDGEISAKILSAFHAILIFGSSGKPFSRREISSLSDFVRYGGSLIIASQAWSWSYKEYGNKPNKDFPLNALGRELGYRITENNIFGPDFLDKELKKRIKNVNKKNWDPSQIELLADETRVFIRDTRGRIIAGSFVHGKGRVIVCGHDKMLEENPNMLKFFLTDVVR
jgi:hypothetical protein